jgi:hypothetical protein
MKKAIVLRVLASLVVGVLVTALFSEISFRLLGNTTSRPPGTVELVIPPGTAEMVASGQAAPAIPEGMVFVIGDTLVVINQDSAPHTLGPLYVPAGASASLTLETAGAFSYSCSFEPSQFFGLDVQEPLTIGTRLRGILLAGIPLGILLALYAVIAWPLKK